MPDEFALGTSSKARNIPIKKRLLKSGARRPQPLRSAKHPDGYPWLRGINKLKVKAASRGVEDKSGTSKSRVSQTPNHVPLQFQRALF